MKFSFKFFLILASIFIYCAEEFSVQEAQAGVVVRRRIRSKFRTKVKKSTTALKRTIGSIGGGKTFGTKKSINAVYKARLKEYKIALKYWQKEKKLAERLEKEYAKKREKQLKEEAKVRAQMARILAKQKERQQIEIAQAKEEASEQVEQKESEKSKDSKKSESIFSKLTSKADSAKTKYNNNKTNFRKDKLKFMSRLFLSLFGKD